MTGNLEAFQGINSFPVKRQAYLRRVDDLENCKSLSDEKFQERDTEHESSKETCQTEVCVIKQFI